MNKTPLPSTHVEFAVFSNGNETKKGYKQILGYPGTPIPPGWVPYTATSGIDLETVTKRPIVNMVDLSDGMENPARVKEVFFYLCI